MIVISKPPEGKLAVKNIWLVNGNLQFTVSNEEEVAVSSHLLGYASQTLEAVKNIYCDDEGNIYYETDSKPQQFVVSEPPSGYKRITNIYYNPDVGDVEVEYEES